MNISVFQVFNQPTVSPESPARVRRPHAALRPHIQLDRTEAYKGVRESSRLTQHGGHHHRRPHTHAR